MGSRRNHIEQFVFSYIRKQNTVSGSCSKSEGQPECVRHPESLREFGVRLLQKYLENCGTSVDNSCTVPSGWLVRYPSTRQIAFVEHSHVRDIAMQLGETCEPDSKMVAEILECKEVKPVFGELEKVI